MREPEYELLVQYSCAERDNLPIPPPPLLAVVVEPRAFLCDPAGVECRERDLALLGRRALRQAREDGLLRGVESGVALGWADGSA